MLALPCSRIYMMTGFVTMEKMILIILLMLWQVFHSVLSGVYFLLTLSRSACLILLLLSLYASFIADVLKKENTIQYYMSKRTY